MAKHSNNVPRAAVNVDTGPLSESAIFAVDRLRHAAVHRLPTTAAGVLQMVLSAAGLATTLNDTGRAARIERLYHEIQALVRDMKINKEFLESRLDKELKDFDDQRIKLDNRERDAVAAMIRDDDEYQSSMSSPLDQTVASLFDGFQDMPLAALEPWLGTTTNPTSPKVAACNEDDFPHSSYGNVKGYP